MLFRNFFLNFNPDSWGPLRSARLVALIACIALSAVGCNSESDSSAKESASEGPAGSSSSSGSRGLKLCNMTPSRVGVSIGFKSTKGWVSEGWWNIASNTCETVVNGKLINRYYYLHVLDYDQSGEWSGKLHMCTDDEPYEIVGVENCSERGYNRTGFFEVDTGEESGWTVRLEDTKEVKAKDQ